MCSGRARRVRQWGAFGREGGRRRRSVCALPSQGGLVLVGVARSLEPPHLPNLDTFLDAPAQLSMIWLDNEQIQLLIYILHITCTADSR